MVTLGLTGGGVGCSCWPPTAELGCGGGPGTTLAGRVGLGPARSSAPRDTSQWSQREAPAPASLRSLPCVQSCCLAPLCPVRSAMSARSLSFWLLRVTDSASRWSCPLWGWWRARCEARSGRARGRPTEQSRGAWRAWALS